MGFEVVIWWTGYLSREKSAPRGADPPGSRHSLVRNGAKAQLPVNVAQAASQSSWSLQVVSASSSAQSEDG